MDAPDPAARGGVLTYNVTVNNVSDVAAENVTVTDALPAGVTLISATPSQGSCQGTTCSLGTIGAHQAAAIAYVVTVDTDAPNTLTNVACVASSTSDSDLTNNCDEEDTHIPGIPTALGETATPQPPAGLPPTGGLPGAESTGGQLVIALGIMLALIGVGAVFAARKRSEA